MNSKDERLEAAIEESFGMTNSDARKLVDPIKNMMENNRNRGINNDYKLKPNF